MLHILKKDLKHCILSIFTLLLFGIADGLHVNFNLFNQSRFLILRQFSLLPF